MATDASRPGDRNRSKPTLGRATWLQIVVVATTYLAGRILAAAALRVAFGPSDAAFDPGGEAIASLLVGLALVATARLVTGAPRSRTAVLGLVAFGSVAAVMLEGAAFAPALSPIDRLPLGLLFQLGVTVTTAGAAVVVAPSPPTVVPRYSSSAGTIARGVIGAVLVYVLAYFITGAVNFALVTGPYYAEHAGGLTTPAPSTVLALALAEGLLLVLAAIPMARALAGSRRTRAVACGLVLWVLGGLVPLLQASALADVLRAASAVEILLQKLPLGMAVVWLLAPGGDEHADPQRLRSRRAAA